MREFPSGANRNDDKNKLDYDGFLDPLVIEGYAKYMHKHRFLEDGTMRPSDNWKLGIPREQLIKSKMRHDQDVWKLHHGWTVRDERGEDVDIKTALYASMFNIIAYLRDLEVEDRMLARKTITGKGD